MARQDISTDRTDTTSRFVTRDQGKMLSLNGSNSYVTCPVAPDTTGFNIAFYLLPRRLSTQQRVCVWMAGGPTGGFTFEFTGAQTQFTWDIRNGGSVQASLKHSMVKGELYHVVGTFAPNDAKLYINGELVASDDSCAMSVPAAQTLTLGKASAGSSQYTYGYMDQFILHNTTTPWTAQEVADLYYRGTVPTGVDVLYNMADNVEDSSGNGNDGTASNVSYVSHVNGSSRTAKTFTSTTIDKLRGWNYSSNYLNGSSSNPWYQEPNQLPFDAADFSEANMKVVKIYGTEANESSHLDAIDAMLAVDSTLKFIVLDFVTYNTDYSQATGGTNRANKISDFEDMVTIFSQRDAVIGYGFGNENNYNLGSSTSKHDWYLLMEEAIIAGKAIDDTRFYYSAIGDVADIENYGHLVPSIDVWGTNVYRGTTFTDLLEDIQRATRKPVIITEFGRKRADNTTAEQQTQADEVIDQIAELESYYPTIRAWIHFKYTHTRVTDTGDEFWEATLPLAEGVNQARTRMQLYTAIKEYANKNEYAS